MTEEEKLIRAEAWDEGYRAGDLDGYFGMRDHSNPYRESRSEGGAKQ